MTCPPVRGLAVVEARAHRVVSGSVVQTVTGRRHIEVLDQTGRFGEAGFVNRSRFGYAVPSCRFRGHRSAHDRGSTRGRAGPPATPRPRLLCEERSIHEAGFAAGGHHDGRCRPPRRCHGLVDYLGGGGAVSGQEARLVSLPAPRTRSGSVLSSALPGFLNSCSEAQFRTTKCMQVTTLAETCAHHPERVGRRPRPPELRQTVWSGPVKRREPHHRPHSVTTASQDWNLPRIPVWRKAVVEAAAGTAGGKGSGGQAGLQQAGLRAEGAEVPATGGGGAPAVGV